MVTSMLSKKYSTFQNIYISRRYLAPTRHKAQTESHVTQYRGYFRKTIGIKRKKQKWN
jgi:hypothetical protein